MAQATERVFIVGGTGNVGSKVVRDLITNNVPTTLYARNPSKVASLFPNGKHLVDVVQGDYSDFSSLEESLPGHSRLFLLLNDVSDMMENKLAIARLAYKAGVKQIVDVSSCLAGPGWRPTYIGECYRLAEESMRQIPGRGAYVALRPCAFMSNIVILDAPQSGVARDVVDANAYQSWISPNDIGALAAILLRESIEKHGDAVYEMVGEILTPAERAGILSRVIGRPVTYEKMPTVEKYNVIKAFGYNHLASYDLTAMPETDQVTVGLPILLGRDPETLEEYLTSKKKEFNLV
ncbi:hypothetical protein EC973_006220 [Apophysomyces ossiformis]|uniref:NAD(P)-binding domain-containing protein n=1 Tax=Apophysomyces ossiformis TaxID=679940 RepID=A0A8H7EJU9_9FUNG|nr:hypothetical protein EC973_006220 [Apophysomyces ossiformis]